MDAGVPDDPLGFIKRCLRERKLRWSYHIDQRLPGRDLTREDILSAVDSLEIIEEYPEDKYLPSYLLLGAVRQQPLHLLAAADVAGDIIRIVTAYKPDPREWDGSYRRRLPK